MAGNLVVYTPPRPSRFADQLGSAAGKERAGVRQAAGRETELDRQQAARQKAGSRRRGRETESRQRDRVGQGACSETGGSEPDREIESER